MSTSACNIRCSAFSLTRRCQICSPRWHRALARSHNTAQKWMLHRHKEFVLQAAPDTQQGASRVHEERPPPWSFGFQTNERYLKWDESAQRQLLKLHVAAKLDKEVSWVEDKLQELASIIPDLEGKMDRMKADIVMQLVSDTQAVAQRVLDVHALLPNVDVSKLLAQYPHLIFKLELGKISQQLHLLRKELPGKDIDDLIQREPLMLTANIKYALEELKRLTPAKDHTEFLFKNPGLVLSMDEHMMESTIDGDLTQP